MIENIFPTPIYRKALSKEILKGLKLFVKNNSLMPTRNVGNSTKGGFQSDERFLASKDPAILALKEGIFACVSEYFPSYYLAQTRRNYEGQGLEFDLWGWLTMLQVGGFNSPHIHPRSTISGVFYVQTPEQIIKNNSGDFSGWLGFMDPRENSQIWPLAGHVNYYFIPPEPGTMVLFPSYLSHFVPPYQGEGQRIAIAFNLRHKSLQPEVDPGVSEYKGHPLS